MGVEKAQAWEMERTKAIGQNLCSIVFSFPYFNLVQEPQQTPLFTV